MKEKQKTVVVESLNVDHVTDSTTTKGKVNGSFTIVDETEMMTEKTDKNTVFALVNDFFCTVKFDDSVLRQSLHPLVDSGIMSEDVFNSTISKAKTEFLNAHKDEIQKGENLSFSDVVSKLKENQSLYNKVLSVCNISEIRESDYITTDNRVQIFRANQSFDSEGKARYSDVTLKQTYNGKTFESKLFVEYRDITTSNIILSIRYRQSYLDSAKRLVNQINDYKRILLDVADIAKKAKENGFTHDQIISIVESIFN